MTGLSRTVGWRTPLIFGVGVGSLARCGKNPIEPTMMKNTDKIRPVPGWSAVPSSVATIGPMTKTTSSTAASNAYAVVSCFGVRTTFAQRARTSAPGEPHVAPDSPAKMNNTHEGACRTAAPNSPMVASADTTRDGTIMTAWPR